MQLLTASKLSTVAMLAMVAVLHFSVSAVPMEQGAGVEEVPPPKAPSLSDYRSTEDGKPSEQAIKDMLAIYTLVEPQAADVDSSPVPDNAKTLFDTLPMETLVKTTDFMDANSRKNFAQTGPRNYEAVQDRSPRFVNALVTGLDELWDAYKKENTAKGLFKWSHWTICAASSVWEEVVKKATRQKLTDCPYHQLPYTPDERPEGQNPSEKELLRMAEVSEDKFRTYVRHNVCRLAVNGAYSWLLWMLAMDESDSRNEIFTVLGQLKLFTSDSAFASDLGKALKLFATISKADDKRMEIPDDLRPLSMIASPETIPVMKHSRNDIKKATLLLLAAQQQQSKTVAHMKVGGKDLVDIAKMGNMDGFLKNVMPFPNGHYPSLGLSFGLNLQLVEFNKSLGKTYRQAINDLLDDPSSGFESDGKIINPSKVYYETVNDLNPFELLVRLLSKDQLKAFYDDTFKLAKNPDHVILGGSSKDKSEFMKRVFEEIFGGEGVPIPGDLEIQDWSVNASNLASLAQRCAIACADENWQVFVDMFVKKVQSTPELPGKVRSQPSSATLPQEVAEHIGECVDDIEYENQKARKKTPEDKNPEIQAQVDTVMKKLQALAKTLSAPIGVSSPVEVSAPVEGTPAKSQPSQ